MTTDLIDGWVCPNCTAVNTSDRVQCKKCLEPAPASTNGRAVDWEPPDDIPFDAYDDGDDRYRPAGPRTTWEPADLTDTFAVDPAELAPDAIIRSDGVAISYSGTVSGICGEPETGKSLIEACFAGQEVQAGRSVIWVDFEDSALLLVERLRGCGLTDSQIAAHVLYLRPTAPFTPTALAQLKTLLETHTVRLSVFDAMVGAMALHALDPNKAEDVEKIHEHMFRPIARLGPAVHIIDHVVKSAASRGRWFTGSERKLGALTGAAFAIKTVTPFRPGGTGKARVLVVKDRRGWLRRLCTDPQAEQLADVTITSEDDRIVMALDPPGPGGDWQPTLLMGRVSDYLAEHDGEWITTTTIQKDVKGKGEYIRLAIDELVALGHVEREVRGRAREHRFVSHYDPTESDET